MNSPNVPLVFFIHGLNTFGDDLIHIGPLTFGPMVGSWKPRLREIGCEVYSLNEMGFGSINDQADRAMKQIGRVLAQASTDAPVILLGHSMGGLVARAVAKRMESEFPGRVKTLITLGSPHKAAHVADSAFNFHERSPKLYRLLKLVGYDIRDRLEHLNPLRLTSLEEFNASHPVISTIDNVSLVGSVTWHQIGIQYKMIYNDLHPNKEASDGLIHSESQRWARDGGTFALDHLGQLGFLGLLSPFAKRNARKEFDRLVKTVQDIIKTNSKSKSASN